MTTPSVLLLLAWSIQANEPEVSLNAAVRIAACGPTESDRAALERLMRGPSYDHIGGGFNDWPGGPKTLAANAWYLNALVAAHEAKPDLFVRNMALDTVGFVLRDLKDAAGGFFRALGNEKSSAYYAFSEQELRGALGPEKSQEFFANFALAPGGFPRLTGSPFAGLADSRQTLLLRRLRRVRLPLDNAIDSDANGLWIGALSRAAIALKRHDFMEAANRGALAIAQSAEAGGAGTAFGLARLQWFGGAPSSPGAASQALDRAIERRRNASAADLILLAWSLTDALRQAALPVRQRQLTRVFQDLQGRSHDTDTAARCLTDTSRTKAPVAGSHPRLP